MKSKLLYILTTIVLVAGIYVLASRQNPKDPKCPDDFPQGDAGEAAQAASMEKWTNDFFDSHPGANLSDWSAARHQFWVDNNCTEALKRYQAALDGTADSATTERINGNIQGATVPGAILPK